MYLGGYLGKMTVGTVIVPPAPATTPIPAPVVLYTPVAVDHVAAIKLRLLEQYKP